MILAEPDIEAGLVISREFAVPRDVVWLAWTDPHRLARWWVPQAMTAPSAALTVTCEEIGHRTVLTVEIRFDPFVAATPARQAELYAVWTGGLARLGEVLADA